MLILTRKKDESVVIGDVIHVIYMGISDEHAILGFSAPRNIPVHRQEIYKLNKVMKMNTVQDWDIKNVDVNKALILRNVNKK